MPEGLSESAAGRWRRRLLDLLGRNLSVVVLVLLCLISSAATWREQNPITSRSGAAVARQVLEACQAPCSVLLVARDTEADRGVRAGDRRGSRRRRRPDRGSRVRPAARRAARTGADRRDRRFLRRDRHPSDRVRVGAGANRRETGVRAWELLLADVPDCPQPAQRGEPERGHRDHRARHDPRHPDRGHRPFRRQPAGAGWRDRRGDGAGVVRRRRGVAGRPSGGHAAGCCRGCLGRSAQRDDGHRVPGAAVRGHAWPDDAGARSGADSGRWSPATAGGRRRGGYAGGGAGGGSGLRLARQRRRAGRAESDPAHARPVRGRASADDADHVRTLRPPPSAAIPRPLACPACR